MQMSKLESACCEVMHVMSLPSRKEIMQEMTKLFDYVGGTVLFLAFWWWMSKLLDCIYYTVYGLSY